MIQYVEAKVIEDEVLLLLIALGKNEIIQSIHTFKSFMSNTGICLIKTKLESWYLCELKIDYKRTALCTNDTHTTGIITQKTHNNSNLVTAS